MCGEEETNKRYSLEGNVTRLAILDSWIQYTWVLAVYSLVPSPTPSFSVLSSDEKLGVGLGTRLGSIYSCNKLHLQHLQLRKSSDITKARASNLDPRN